MPSPTPVISLPPSTNDVAARHWLRMPAPAAGSGMELFTFSGIAIFNGGIKCQLNSGWDRKEAFINASYPNIAAINKAILPTNWTVSIHLSSIFDQQAAVNGGWAVDEYSMLLEKNGIDGKDVALANGILRLRAKIALQDIDAYIHRLSYQVTILGKVVNYQPPIIP